MHPEIVIVPVVFLIPAVVIIVRMAFRHREKMAAFSRPSVESSGIEARLERVEQSLEAIAIEMERVGEGQRFLTRLLANKPQALSDGAEVSPERVNNPR